MQQPMRYVHNNEILINNSNCDNEDKSDDNIQYTNNYLHNNFNNVEETNNIINVKHTNNENATGIYSGNQMIVFDKLKTKLL
jgi:sulfopyruvate decarboxylase TPP-binding subunit